MKHQNRIAAVLLTVVLCISVLGAAFCVAAHTAHDCTGESCAVCAVLAECEQRIHGAAAAAVTAFLMLLCALYAVSERRARTREAAEATPVTLKVKLLN